MAEGCEGRKKDERRENPTVDKMRSVMSLVYKSGMRYGERRSARGSECHARYNGCSTGVVKLKKVLATGYAKTLKLAKL